MNVEESALYREFVSRNAASRAHAERVRRVVPTGTSRALLRHPPFPFFTVRAAGIHSWDLDGNRRIDLQRRDQTRDTARHSGQREPGGLDRSSRESVPRQIHRNDVKVLRKTR